MASSQLDRAFTALAHPTRRAIVQRLASGRATVNELAEPFEVSLPSISRHLRVLEAAGLIAQEREGQFRRCHLDSQGLKTAGEWLDFYRSFWSQSFDRLDEHLQTSKAKGKTRGKLHRENRQR
jgi:DNA-binding transcriptional ArsR family regulator